MLNFVGGAPFTTGRAEYVDHEADVADGSARVLVRVAPQGSAGPILAQLDTGAAWSVLNAEIAEELGLLGGDGEPITLSTRLGYYDGRLENTTITTIADDGRALDVDATVFVSQDWPGPTFLGYRGLLERIRFALDPQANNFYFGGY